LGEAGSAVAAIETYEKDGTTVHEMRSFVSGFEAALGLEEEGRILIQSGTAIIADLVPAGGEAISDPAIALQVDEVDNEGRPRVLRVLGASSAQTSKPTLALAVREGHFDGIEFSSGFTDLGLCPASNRRVVQFSGTARLAHHGVRCTWRTAAEHEISPRLILVGETLRKVRELVYRGVPRIWKENDGHLSEPRPQALRWRPSGHGAWRLLDQGKPYGEIELAIVENGEIQTKISASIVPEDFDIAIDRVAREIRISGLETTVLVAQGGRNLDIRFEDDEAIICLGPPSATPTIEVRPRWDAELSLSLRDPSYELRLLNSKDEILPRHAQLSVKGLRGVRVVAIRETQFFMELRAPDAPRTGEMRTMLGEIPLTSLSEGIVHLLGSSEHLDAKVILSAIGMGDHIAEIRRYSEDVDPFELPKLTSLGALASVLLESRHFDVCGLSLTHPASGIASVVAPATVPAMQLELRKLAPGPWLIFGTRTNGATLRPRIVPNDDGPPQPDVGLLGRAIRLPDVGSRAEALRQAYLRPSELPAEDTKNIYELLAVAEREGIPYSAIDALRELGRAPELATRLLASSTSTENRASLISLQRDLPFLWTSSLVKHWVVAFSKSTTEWKEKLSEIQADPRIAYHHLVSALDEIVGFLPELAGHARAVFFSQVAIVGDHQQLLGDSKPNFLRPQVTRDSRTEIGALICRHDDTGAPPQNVLGARQRDAHKAKWAHYDERFIDVITAPFAVAYHACGHSVLTEKELRGCRICWLYDPKYFESVVPAAIEVIVRRSGVGDRKND
jgi:hypothetical protein